MDDTELCGETFTCEHCEKDFPIEQQVDHIDVSFCTGCDAEWRKEFAACQHDWRPSHDDHGEPGQYCRNCTGFVLDEMFPDLFGKPAPSRDVQPPTETA
jgi:hypothetical protein